MNLAIGAFMFEGELSELSVLLESSKAVRMYEPPQDGATYIVGVDAAGGGQSGDYSVAMVGGLDVDGFSKADLERALAEDGEAK